MRGAAVIGTEGGMSHARIPSVKVRKDSLPAGSRETLDTQATAEF